MWLTRSACCCLTVTRSGCCLTVTRSGCCCLTVTSWLTVTRTGCCCVTHQVWMLLSDCHQVWMLLFDCHHVWELLSDCHQVWMLLSDCHQIWMLLFDCHQVWELLCDCHQVWMLLSDCHQVWMLLFDCHQVWVFSDCHLVWVFSDCHLVWMLLSDCHQVWMLLSGVVVWLSPGLRVVLWLSPGLSVVVWLSPGLGVVKCFVFVSILHILWCWITPQLTHHSLVAANHWMMCDDLQHPVCEFSKCAPSFPPSQVHIVMWERQSYRGNPVGVETATHFPTATTDVVTIDGLARIATQTTTGLPPGVSTGLPPGVSTGLPPGVATGLPPGVATGLPPGVSTGLPPGVTVIVTPALVAANTSDVPHQPGTWVAVSPVGSVAPVGTYQSATAPVARNSHVVHGNTRTKTGRLTERLQRCREKFERAKAIRPRAVATPTVTCVRNLQCGQSYAMSRPALPSAQSVVSQSAVTPRLDHCDGQLSLGAHVSSSHKPRGMPTVTCGGVRGGMSVTRSVPVFAGYTAKAHGRKRDVSDVNCSGEINSGVNASSSLNSGVNTSSSANTGANTSTSLNSGVNNSSSTHHGVNTSVPLNGGVITSCSANTGASTSLNGGVSTLTTAKSSVSHTNTAVSKKRVIRQSGGSVKRRRVSSPPVVSTHDTKCVTSTEPETCHSTQNCQERECVTTQVDTTDDNPDKFADVLDELCSTLDMSDVSPSVHQYDDVIDFDSLLAV